ncbi:hypothetical protein Aperf_G00000064568 [Anoplocephala perfoliata]
MGLHVFRKYQSNVTEVNQLMITCNESRRTQITWFNPPEIAFSNYIIKVEETENRNPYSKLLYSPRGGNISVELMDLKPFTNYTVTLTDYKQGAYINIATAFARTCPKAPANHWNITSKSNGASIFFDRDISLKTANYSASATPVGSSQTDSAEVECESQEKACHFDGLLTNTVYKVRIRVCTNDFGNFRCSDWSAPAQIYTGSAKPTNLTVSECTESSLLVVWQPPNRNSELITQYKIILSNTRPAYVPGTTTKALVKNLSPKSQHRIQVSACARDKDCSIEEETTAWTTLNKPRDLQVKSVETGVLACKWNDKGNMYKVDAYELDLFEVNGSHPLQNLTLPAKGHFTFKATFKDLPSHAEFSVKLRACFFTESQKLAGSKICSEPAVALVITIPDPIKFNITERTTSSVIFRLIGPVNTSHFNYTLRVLNRASRVTFDSQKHTFTALSLPANTPSNLKIANLTDTTIDASWHRPSNNGDTITSYRAKAINKLGKVYSCVPSTVAQYRTHCSFKGLSPCQPYNISVRTCAREADCGPVISEQAFTLPSSVNGFRLNRVTSTNATFIWRREDMADCELKNITVRLQKQSSGDNAGYCFVSSPDDVNECTVDELMPNTEYTAYAVACSKMTPKCAEKTENIEVTTLPGTPGPVQFVSSTTESIVVRFTLGMDETAEDFTYSVSGYKKGYASAYYRNIRGYCNQSSKECIFEHLQPNTGYLLDLFRCSATKPTLCSLPSRSLSFFYTLPQAPSDLKIANLTDTTIDASWHRPSNNGDTITSYRAEAINKLDKVYSCVPSTVAQYRTHCSFKGLSPCQPYNISVSTCAREADCGPVISEQAFTLPSSVNGFRLDRVTSTNATFIWRREDMADCELKNITVRLQKQSSGDNAGYCFVSSPDDVNECTVDELMPNTEYTAYAVACSKMTPKCAEKTENIEVTTLPGIPLHFQIVEVTSQSVKCKWNPVSGQEDGLEGYLVRIYEKSEDGTRLHETPIADCMVPKHVETNAFYFCRIDKLQPGTNYSATVMAYKLSSDYRLVFGEESEDVFFKTSKCLPLAISFNIFQSFVLKLGSF